MFRSDIQIQGSHATKLYEIVHYSGDDKQETFYPRHIDVYMVAPLIGALYGRKECLCREVVKPRKILADTVIKSERKLTMIYQLIMLLDKRNELNIEDRVYRAFRDHANREHSDNHKKNVEEFNMYVRGGISILHEKITNESSSFEDYMSNYRDFITEFNDDFIKKKDYADFQIDL